ncbi:YkoP family protein [Paenibacillus naphthalenovorans]|uniref:YkoP family protein n=1 Tax=Paenibacillus naphthalenovorans TaxID=162209 RepID=UPI003D2D0AA7
MRLKSIALTVWDILDPIYYACTRLKYIGGGDRKSSAFRVRLTLYKGRPVSLADGTTIQKGDLLLKIHLHNVVLLKNTLALRNELQKARFLYRSIERSLPDLALYVRSHPKCHDIKGLIGITMLNRGYDKLNFEAFPISSTGYKWLKWISLMPIYLLSVTNPFKNMKKHVPTYLFMSKDTLLQKLVLFTPSGELKSNINRSR